MNMPLDIDRDTVLDSCQDCDSDLATDFEELAGSHNVWVASGLSRLRSPAGLRDDRRPDPGVERRRGFRGRRGHGPDRHAGRPRAGHEPDGPPRDGVRSGRRLPGGSRYSPSSGGLNQPAGLTLTPDGQILLVVSRGTDRVIAYDAADGTPLGDLIAAGAGGLALPFGIVYGPNGNLFVSSGDDEVLEFDGLDGSFVGVFVDQADNGGLDRPKGMTFKADGNLLVASFGTDEVLEYDGATGAALGKWAQVGTSSVLTQVSPWGVRVAPNGNVFVVRTGEDFGSSAGDRTIDRLHDDHDHGDHGELHLSNAQMYEYDVANGNFIRTHIGGNDHGLVFPTGFDFIPGWELDCNLSLIPDECELASLPQAPEGDGVPAECAVDCNGNGRLDRLDIIPYGIGAGLQREPDSGRDATWNRPARTAMPAASRTSARAPDCAACQGERRLQRRSGLHDPDLRRRRVCRRAGRRVSA